MTAPGPGNKSGGYAHETPSRVGVLLVNLGTPAAPTAAATRRYLGEFLSDRRVIEAPRWLWWCLLHGVILRRRPKKSAALYAKVWDERGAPLLRHCEDILAALRPRLAERRIVAALGMRYGEPSLRDALERLRQANAQRLLLLPLYPQYSATTTASAFDALADILRTWRWLPETRFVRDYHDDAGYLDALAESARQHWRRRGRPQKLLFSFHGIPERYFLAGDPYHCQCQATARQVAERLRLPPAAWAVAFQSRFGPRRWLQPYTDQLLAAWARDGIRHTQVLCPGFAADCLETLEEIALQNRQAYLRAGGGEFSYVPALNDRPAHIDALLGLIERHTRGWPAPESAAELSLRAQRAAAAANCYNASSSTAPAGRVRGKHD